MNNADETPVERAQRWLDQNGFALEMQAARILERPGVSVVQGSYQTIGTDFGREVDVLATWEHPNLYRPRLRLHLVAECKSGPPGDPWIVFCRDSGGAGVSMAGSMLWAFNSASVRLSGLCRQICDESRLCACPELIGYSAAKTSFKGDGAVNRPQPNLGYAAMVAVAESAAALAEAEASTIDDLVSLIFPVVVTDSPIFQCHLGPGDDEPLLREASHVRVEWKQPVRGRQLPTIIDVVALAAFDRYVEHVADLWSSWIHDYFQLQQVYGTEWFLAR